MVLTIAGIVRLLFQNGKAQFELDACDVVESGRKIRTRFRSYGRTRWGKDVLISGTDYFWLSEASSGAVAIVRHESIWDQTVDEVLASVRMR